MGHRESQKQYNYILHNFKTVQKCGWAFYGLNGSEIKVETNIFSKLSNLKRVLDIQRSKVIFIFFRHMPYVQFFTVKCFAMIKNNGNL